MSTTSFSDLPLDCVWLVIDRIDKSEFSSVSLVCVDVYHLVNNRVRELDLQRGTIPELQTFSRLLQRFPNVKRLTMHYEIESNLDGTLIEIANSNLNLEFLGLPHYDFQYNNFPTNSLVTLSTRMPNLKSLKCSEMVYGDNELAALGDIFPALEELDMSWPDVYVSDEGVERVTKRLPNLRKIDISFNQILTGASLKSLTSNCPLLEEFICYVSSNKTWMSEDSVCEFLTNCPHLKKVELAGLFEEDMPNYHLAEAICSAKYLRYLSLDSVVLIDKYSPGNSTEIDVTDYQVCATQIQQAFISASWKYVEPWYEERSQD